ncbi:MAG: hypothetical protein QM523_09440 [Candidatus Pacebacteria bacterium]|nr:hypothetical protein [Candidatus Paceibacterota bacterium]
MATRYDGEKTAPYGVNFPPKTPRPTLKQINASYFPPSLKGQKTTVKKNQKPKAS